MKTFEIDSIGIEYEFVLPTSFENSKELCQSIIDKANLDSEFIITLDREFYDEQVEFKLMRTTDIEWGISHFQKFIIDIYSHIPGITSTTERHYVGTHIHMFINKDSSPYTNFARWKKIALVRYAYCTMAKWMMEATSLWLRRMVIKNELSRLTRNHNILRYFDGKIGNILKNNLERARLTYQQFHNGTDKPKYSPVLWSLPNVVTWKPHSLEIRCIPNTYLLVEEPSKIAEYILWVENILNEKNPHTNEEDINQIWLAHSTMVHNYLLT